jgi:hypothetical protein
MLFWQERQEAALSKITGRKEADGIGGNGGTGSVTTEERKRDSQDSHQEDSDEGIIKGRDKPSLLVDVRGGDRKSLFTWYRRNGSSYKATFQCLDLPMSPLEAECRPSLQYLQRDVTD